MQPQEYERMIARFVRGEMPVSQFEKQFLAAFKAQPPGMKPAIFSILQELFSAVDSYWEGCQPGQDTAFEISETSLRLAAVAALGKLRKQISGETAIDPS